MDLLKLNNEISGMRPSARQSVVHVMHFLSKRAKEFNIKNGPEDKKTAYRKKAERLMQEALIIKVLVPDEIIKFALQFDSSLRDKVLNDLSIPLPAKAFVRLACHPSVEEKVKEFREKYPDWNKWLEKSLEKLGTGARFGTKMKNGRVKAHLQQRQRVEEAVDVIRRAHMSWMHKPVKIKVKSEETVECSGESMANGNKSNEDVTEDSSVPKSNKSKNDKKSKSLSKSSSDSDSERESNASFKPSLQTQSKVDKDSNKSKDNSKSGSGKLRPIIFEADEDSSEEVEERVETVTNKKKQMENKKSKKKLVGLTEDAGNLLEDTDEEERVEIVTKKRKHTDNKKSKKKLVDLKEDAGKLLEDTDEEDSSEEERVETVTKKKKHTDNKKSKKKLVDLKEDAGKLLEDTDEEDSSEEERVETVTDRRKHKNNKKSKKKLLDLKENAGNLSDDTDEENAKKDPNSEEDNSIDDDSEDGALESQNKSINYGEIDEKTAKKLLKKAKRKQKVIIPRSRDVEVCKFSELLQKGQTRKNDESGDPRDSDDNKKTSKSPEKGVDPFFMTRDNDFLRLATAKREAKPEEPIRTGPKWGIEGSENWTGTRTERRARARRIMGVPEPEGFSRQRNPSKFNSSSFTESRENNYGGKLPNKKESAVADEPEILHPSWAAKRKLNIASVGFQGKKVKFDDSD